VSSATRSNSALSAQERSSNRMIDLSDGGYGWLRKRSPLLHQVSLLVNGSDAHSWDSSAVAGLGGRVSRRGGLLALVEGRSAVDTHGKVIITLA